MRCAARVGTLGGCTAIIYPRPTTAQHTLRIMRISARLVRRAWSSMSGDQLPISENRTNSCPSPFRVPHRAKAPRGAARRQPFRAGHLGPRAKWWCAASSCSAASWGAQVHSINFGDGNQTCGTNTQQAPYSRAVLLDLKSIREELPHGSRKKDQERALRARRT